MSTMIERAAKAWNDKRDEYICALAVMGDAEKIIGPTPDAELMAWLDAQCARAAIQALREPDEAMVNAAIISMGDYEDDPPIVQCVGGIWTTMISAALGLAESSAPEEPKT